MTDVVPSPGERLRREILGDEHADEVRDAQGFGSAFGDLATRYAWAEVWARPGLDRRTRSAATIASLVALDRPVELALHVQGGLRNGLTVTEIEELLLQSAVYCGMPAARAGFRAAQPVIDAWQASPTPAATFLGLLEDAAARRPDGPALVFPDTRRTYGDLVEAAGWRARELRALGIRRGDRLGILMPNSAELVELLAGAASIGAVVVPINTRFKAAEILHVLRDGRLRALLTTSAVDDHVDFKALLHEALPGLSAAPDLTALSLAEAPELRAVALITDEGAPGMLGGSTLRRIAEAQDAYPPARCPSGADPFLIMYTSGTTAKPKGCVISHGALVENARAIVERFALSPQDRFWDPLPMFHMGGILLLTAVFGAGATFISQSHFDADEAVRVIEAHAPTVLYPTFPTITTTLLHHPRFDPASLHEVRIIVNIGPAEMQHRIQAALPQATLLSAYGMTELCGTVAYSALDDTLEQRTTTCGRPLPGWEVRVVDAVTGEPAQAGHSGELLVRGRCLFDGYFGDDAQTGAPVDEEGFFHTGDRCSIDADGLLVFDGRLKDMLKVGGENVSALEVESFLLTHPAVKLAQVVGVPDDRYVEAPAAFIELVPGTSLTEQDVIDFCSGQIARFKIPRHVRFVTEWPMSSTKVQKFRLRDRLISDLAA
ncbi:MAG: hypothetical protein JWR63_1898 [Conexibacter sp.]|nr:hypothetical protein [Conexibacter sp.]